MSADGMSGVQLALLRAFCSVIVAVLLAGPVLQHITTATAAPVPTPTSSGYSQTSLPTASGSDGPVKRVIVNDLTPFLFDTLLQHNITMLLVLPGPSSDSSTAQQDTSAMKIDWHKLSGLHWVSWVYSYHDFMMKWHSHLRYMQHITSTPGYSPQTPAVSVVKAATRAAQASSQSAATDSSTAAGAAHAGSQPQHTVANSQQQHPTVAVLIQGHNGRLGLQQLNLAASISRRLRQSHRLTLSYSTHTDKADSLVVSTAEAVPLGAAFLSTSVFRDAFNQIYAQKLWGQGGGGSGLGSEVTWTSVIRDQLPRIISKYNITSMLDSSCGSMHWMPKVLQNVTVAKPWFRFMGTDVVCGLIANHTSRFRDYANYQFQCVDYASQRLPSGYDLVFSRDSLQHIPMHGTWQFLNNVKASGARYLLVGSYLRHDGPNADIPAGSYYAIDLMKPPFRCSKPLEVISEDTADGKHMLLFDVQRMTWQDPLWGLV